MREQSQAVGDGRTSDSGKTEATQAAVIGGERATDGRDISDADSASDRGSDAAGTTVTPGSDGSSSSNADAFGEDTQELGDPADSGTDEGYLPSGEPADEPVSTTASMDRSRVGESTQGEVELTAETVDPYELDRQTTGDPSRAQQPDADARTDIGSGSSSGDVGDQAQLGQDQVDNADLSYDDPAALDGYHPSDVPGEADLDEAMNQEGVGGLDGRNDAADGMTSDAGSGDPEGVRDAGHGTAGALTPDQQADLLNAKIKATVAAERGDEDAANEAAAEAYDIVHADDQPDGGSGGTMTGTTGETITTNEDGTELRATEAQEEMAKAAENSDSPIAKAAKVITHQDGSNYATQLEQADDGLSKPPAQAPSGQDMLEGDGALRPGMSDPSSGWGDETAENDWDLGTGGGVTDPADESGGYDSAGSVADHYEADPTDYVAEYEPGPPDPTVDGSELDGVDPNAPVYDELDAG